MPLWETFTSRESKGHIGCSKLLTAPLSVPGSGLMGKEESDAPLTEEAPRPEEGGGTQASCYTLNRFLLKINISLFTLCAWRIRE